MVLSARYAGVLVVISTAVLQLTVASTIVLQPSSSGVQVIGIGEGFSNWKLEYDFSSKPSPAPLSPGTNNGGNFNGAHNFNDRNRMKENNNIDPCLNALNPNSWNKKLSDVEVCGWNGWEGWKYPNVDVLECFNLYQGSFRKKMQLAECDSKTENRFDPCSHLHDNAPQMCGSDNVTYNHIWNMACTVKKYSVQLTIQHVEKCNTKIECPFSPIYKPVCSTDDETFSNEEALRCNQILKPYSKTELKHIGSCKENNTLHANPCFKTAISLDDRVDEGICASNGRTYLSMRDLRCLKVSNPMLQVLHKGFCTVQDVEQIIGVEEACKILMHEYQLSPLCGSDNVTYINAYSFVCAANSTRNNNRLRVAYEGECIDLSKCPAEEPKELYNVCGSDGITYLYLEALLCEKAIEKPTLKMKNYGNCYDTSFASHYSTCSDDETDVGAPDPLKQFLLSEAVCGTNKITYVSKRALSCAAKKQPGIEYLHSGECL